MIVRCLVKGCCNQGCPNMARHSILDTFYVCGPCWVKLLTVGFNEVRNASATDIAREKDSAMSGAILQGLYGC